MQSCSKNVNLTMNVRLVLCSGSVRVGGGGGGSTQLPSVDTCAKITKKNC